MQVHEAGQRDRGAAPVHLGVLADGFAEPVVALVGHVAGQHVEDEALLDGLAHRVQVEGPVRRLAVRAGHVGVALAEQLERLALGGGGEGEERQVALAPSGGGARGQRGQVVGQLVLPVALDLGLGPAQHRLDRAGGLPALAAVRLVDDHGHPPALQTGGGDDGELLQRGDDDLGGGVLQRRAQLLGVAVDAPEHPANVVQAADGGLQLLVQHPAVGDDDDLVEHLGVRPQPGGHRGRREQPGVGGRVQVGQAVREPGDGVRLPRAGAVLQQVAVPGPVDGGVPDQAAHHVPLVVAGEQHAAGLAPGRGPLLDEAVQQVQPGVAVPHLLPQVGAGVPGGRRRVAFAAGLPGAAGALVERQEHRRGAGQSGGDEDQGGVHGEVRHAPPGEDAVAGVAPGGVAVLLDRVAHALPGEVVLQLGGGHGDAVDAQQQVERLPGVGLAVVHLPGHRHLVGVVPLAQLGGQPVRGSEVGHRDRRVALLHPASQHIHGAAGVDLGGDRPGQARLRRRAVGGDELVPLLGLCLTHEASQGAGVQPERRVVPARGARHPAVSEEVGLDGVLERRLGVRRVHEASTDSPLRAVVTSNCPVTAAVMRACLRSRP